MRITKQNLRAPIGIANGPLALTPAGWDAINQLVAHAPRGDWQDVARLLDALASANVVASAITKTVMAEEPDRFRRLWEALEPLYSTYGATTSLKQLASSLGMSMRTGQTSRQAPHRLLAYGSSRHAGSPWSAGVSTAPTGPE